MSDRPLELPYVEIVRRQSAEDVARWRAAEVKRLRIALAAEGAAAATQHRGGADEPQHSVAETVPADV